MGSKTPPLANDQKKRPPDMPAVFCFRKMMQQSSDMLAAQKFILACRDLRDAWSGSGSFLNIHELKLENQSAVRTNLGTGGTITIS